MIHIREMDPSTAALVGFALKAHQMVRGFESVTRAMSKDQLAGILVNDQLSHNTLDRIEKYQKRNHLDIIKTGTATDWVRLWGIDSHKILGIMKGDLGRQIIKNFKVGV